MSDPVTVEFKSWGCYLTTSQYPNGTTAIQLWSVVDGSPIATATCAIDQKPDSGCVFIKNYSENEGMLDALTKAGVIGPVQRVINNGYVDVYEVELLKALRRR
jgi:hypothetical protein